MRKKLFYVAAGVLGIAATVLAGEASATDEEGRRTIGAILIELVPWIIVFLIIWFFVFRALRRPQPVNERLMLHMERVEQKYDRIIQLLERLVDRQVRDEDLKGPRDQSRDGAGGSAGSL